MSQPKLPPQLAILVVNYGSHELVEKNLHASLLDEPDVAVVVVDNFTTAAERGAVANMCARRGWIAALPDRNLGFGAGMNLAANIAADSGATDFLLINPDAYTSPASIELLLRAVRRDPMTLAAPVVRRIDGAIYSAETDLYLRTGLMRSRRRRPQGMSAELVEPWLSGACLMVSSCLWNTVNGFDPDYFLYWEDVDLSKRISEAGGSLRVVHEATAVHDEGSTHGYDLGRAKSPIYYYYNVRNRMVYAAKHLTFRQQLRWLIASPGVAHAILLQGGRRQFLRPTSSILPATRGMVDGLRYWVRHCVPDRGAARPRDIRVLTSYRTPRSTTNPYIVMLDTELRKTGGMSMANFSWRTVFSRKYDVFHTHWTETITTASSGRRSMAKQWLLLAAISWMRVRRVPIVRTVHNVDPPEGLSKIENLNLRLIDQDTRMRIVLNAHTPVPADEPSMIIPHGSYSEWFSRYADSTTPSIPGRVGYFGLVRRYKGVEDLVRAYEAARVVNPGISLLVTGKPSSPDLAGSIGRLSASAIFDFRYISDAEVVEVASSSQVVVFPGRAMHNSGSALAALSIGRPILVIRNAVNEALADEVGRCWVTLFDEEVTGPDIIRALAAAEKCVHDTPNLSQRGWTTTGQRHLDAYRLALGPVCRFPAKSLAVTKAIGNETSSAVGW